MTWFYKMCVYLEYNHHLVNILEIFVLYNIHYLCKQNTNNFEFENIFKQLIYRMKFVEWRRVDVKCCRKICVNVAFVTFIVFNLLLFILFILLRGNTFLIYKLKRCVILIWFIRRCILMFIQHNFWNLNVQIDSIFEYNTTFF